MFTIGEFSRLGQISTRMLRHYDQLGLLIPAQIGAENGYRYYTAEQLTRLHEIECWKRYGFPLAEIGTLLDLSRAEQCERLRERHAELCLECARLHVLTDQLAYTLRKMEGKLMKQTYEIKVQPYDALEVYGVRKVMPCEGKGIENLIGQTYQQAERKGLRPNGPVLMAFYGEGFDPQNADMEFCIPVARQTADTHTLPGCLGLSTVHYGPFEEINEAYTAIAQWLSDHPTYRMDGQVSYERFLVSPHTARTPEEIQTEIWFPIAEL